MTKGSFAEQYTVLNNQVCNKKSAFGIFVDKTATTEKSVHKNGYYSEEKVERTGSQQMK